MKCLSCGKNYNYEKYYGVCPKCGTYNKEMKETQPQADSWTPEQSMWDDAAEQTTPEQSVWDDAAEQTTPEQGVWDDAADQTTQEQNVWEEDDNPYSRQESRGEKQQTKRGTRRVILTIIAVTLFLNFVFTITGNIVSDHQSEINASLDQDSGYDSELPITAAKMQEEITIEDTYGKTLIVKDAEILAEAGEQAGFPEGQRLVAVHIEGNPVSEISYDTYENPPVRGFYLKYDDMYRDEVSSYHFEDGYNDLIGRRQSISDYEFSVGEQRSGYLFFFVPQEAETLSFVVAICDPSSGTLTRYVEVPLELELPDSGADDGEGLLEDVTGQEGG